MAAKFILMVVLLKWALSSDIPGIDTKQPQSGDFGCKDHGCVDTSNDVGDSDAVDNGPFVQKQELEDTVTNIITQNDGPKIIPESDKSRAKSCPAKKKCINLGGVCVEKGTCTDVVVSKKCTNKCDCCQIKTTHAPLTTSTPWSPLVELMQCCNTTHHMLHKTERNMVNMETNLETNQDELMWCCNTTHQMLEKNEKNIINMETNLETIQDDIEVRIDALGQELTNKIDNTTDNLDQVLGNLVNQIDNNITNTIDGLRVNITGELQTMDIKIDSLINTLEYIITYFPGLPKRVRCYRANGFLSPTEDQCFVYYDVRLNWEAAASKCRDNGLQLVTLKDHNAVWLSEYVLDNYGDGWSWMSARADGTKFTWTVDGKIIPSSNPLWWPAHPGPYVGTNWCLVLRTDKDSMGMYPGKPYYPQMEHSKHRPLCELI